MFSISLSNAAGPFSSLNHKKLNILFNLLFFNISAGFFLNLPGLFLMGDITTSIAIRPERAGFSFFMGEWLTSCLCHAHLSILVQTCSNLSNPALIFC